MIKELVHPGCQKFYLLKKNNARRYKLKKQAIKKGTETTLYGVFYHHSDLNAGIKITTKPNI
jgi:hypothetical protein